MFGFSGRLHPLALHRQNDAMLRALGRIRLQGFSSSVMFRGPWTMQAGSCFALRGDPIRAERIVTLTNSGSRAARRNGRCATSVPLPIFLGEFSTDGKGMFKCGQPNFQFEFAD